MDWVSRRLGLGNAKPNAVGVGDFKGSRELNSPTSSKSPGGSAPIASNAELGSVHLAASSILGVALSVTVGAMFAETRSDAFAMAHSTRMFRREAFKALMQQFHQNNKTDESRITALASLFPRIIDTLADANMREITESSTCLGEIRLLAGLTAKAMRLAFHCEKQSIPVLSESKRAMENLELIQLYLRVIELFSIPDNEQSLTAISQAKFPDQAMRLLWLLSHTSMDDVDEMFHSGYWASKQDTFHAVAKSIGDLLRNLCRRDSTARDVDVQTLFRILLKPAPETDQDTAVWLQCTSKVLAAVTRSSAFDIELCGWIKLSGHVKSLLVGIREASLLTKLNSGAILFTSLADILKESFKYTAVLIEDFEESGGYGIIVELLLACGASDSSAGRPEPESTVLRALEGFAFIGTEDPESYMMGDIEAPFQHADFRLPVSNSGLTVNNLAVMEVFKRIFQSSSQTAREAPTHPCFWELLKIWTLWILPRRPADLPTGKCAPEAQKDVLTCVWIKQAMVLEMLRYVILDLNYVPFKWGIDSRKRATNLVAMTTWQELAILFVHFQGNSSSKTIGVICEFFTQLLTDSRRLKDVFRDLGLLSMLSSLIAEFVKHYGDAPETGLRESPFSFDGQAFVIGEPLVQNFDTIMGLLRLMLENIDNVNSFKNRSREHVFELVKYKPLRRGAFLVIEAETFPCIAPAISLKCLNGQELLCGDLSKTTIRSSTVGDQFELHSLIEALQTHARNDVPLKVDILTLIKKALSLSLFTRHAFRLNGGFEALVSAIQSMLLRLWFETLISAVDGCAPSRKYLEEQIGNRSIEEALLLDYIQPNNATRLVYGGLVALAFENTVPEDTNYRQLQDLVKSGFSSHSHRLLLRNQRFVSTIARLLTETLQLESSVVVVVLELLHHTSMSNKHNQVCMSSSGLLEILFGWLFDRRSCWFIKTVASDSSGSTLERSVQDSDPSLFKKRCETLILSIAKRLVEVGVSDAELQYLFSRIDVQRLNRSSEDQQTILLEFLLHGLRFGRSPSYLHFDETVPMSGTGCLMLPDYGRPFPPVGGYTLMCWVRIEKFDPVQSVRIMTIIDSDDKERLCVSIEGGSSRRLSIQTIKATCRFDSFVFHEREWVHVAIVHQKPRISASTVELYINGSHTGSAKCGYLGHPGSASKVQTFIGNHLSLAGNGASLGTESSSSNSSSAYRSHGRQQSNMDGRSAAPSRFQPGQAQAQTLSSCQSVWDLGPTYFIEEVLLDADAISIIYDMRFETVANWQGYAPKYQPIEKKARKPVVHLEEDSSPLASISFVLGPAKPSADTLGIPEDKILFSLCANNSLEIIVQLHDLEMCSGLASIAAKILPSTNAIFNSAFPKPSPEVDADPELAYIKGDVLVVCPKRVIDGIWKLGGCAILLKLIDMSTTSDTLYQSVSVLVESLEHNWRNAAEMEKCHFYEVLSHLLKQKRELITIAIMDVVLILVGRTLENTDDATLSNGQALRHLFLDIELWRTTPELQRYYLTQMTDFIVHSSNREHNIQKLNKMVCLRAWSQAMIKRILLMLKLQIIPIDLVPDLVTHLKIFVRAGWSSDTVKSICTYLMYTLPKEDDFSEVRDMTAKLKPSTTKKPLEDAPLLITSAKQIENKSYSVRVRNIVLEMLFEILGDKHDGINYATEFVRIISSRWIVLFSGPRLDCLTVTTSLRIFARLWMAHDLSRPSKFKEGFLVLSRLLQPYSSVLQLYNPLLAILCGIDIETVPEDVEFEVSKLMAVMKPQGTKSRRNLSPDVMRVLMSLVTQSVRLLTKWSDIVDSLEKTIKAEPKIQALSRKLFDGSTDSLQETAMVRQSENETETARTNLEALANVVQVNVQFVGSMYRHFDDIKDCVCRQESLDDIVGLLFQLTSTGNPVSIEKELAAKGEYPDVDAFSQETMFLPGDAADKNEEALKLKLKYVEIEAPASVSDAALSASNASHLRGESMFALAGRSHAQLSGDAGEGRGQQDQGQARSLFALCNTSPDNLTPMARGLIDTLIELTMTITVESILGTWKPFQGLEMVLKAIPPSTRKAQIYFQNFILSCTMNAVHAKISRRKSYLADPRVLSTLGKFMTLLVDRAFQVTTGTAKDDSKLMAILDRIVFYQKIILSQRNADMECFKGLVHHLFAFLSHEREPVRKQALAIWKLVLLQKPSQVSTLLRSPRANTDYKDLVDGFSKILEMDSSAFVAWLPTKHDEVSAIIQENATRVWEQFCQVEARNARESLKAVNRSRFLKLKKQYKRMSLESEVFVKYLTKSKAWVQDVQKMESDRFQRFKQDYAVMVQSIDLDWTNLANGLFRERAVWGPDYEVDTRWKLDFTEAKARIRRKMRRNNDAVVHYQSKHEKILLSAKAVKAPEIASPHDADVSAGTPADQETTNAGQPAVRPEVLESAHVAKQTSACPLIESIDGAAGQQQASDTLEPSALGENASETFTAEAAGTPSSAMQKEYADLSVGIDHSALTDAELENLNDDDFSPTNDDDRAKEMAGNDTLDEAFSMDSKPKLRLELSTDNLFDKQEAEAENDWEEVILEEDQNRKILRLLEIGDEIVDTVNCARLVGLELCDGLCILCQDNIYLIDNYFQRGDGEIVDIDDVPLEERNLYHNIVKSSKKSDVAEDEDRHACRKCSYNDIKEVHKRLYLFRNVAFEIFLSDGRNFLLTFWSTRARDAVYSRMLSKAALNTTESVAGINPTAGQGMLQNVIFAGSPLADLTQKWCSREISNFAYLMHLNTLAGRSYNDLTQYPVFPWILADYESDQVDLTNEKSFRDLSKPMGAQPGSSRAAEFDERYRSWDDPSIPGCHYGTHYSSSMIVCSFLLRIEPFTQQYLKLQGGHFDHPDRLFHSIGGSWASASRLNTTDVRELIPEFFYLPEFLRNHNKFEFGVKQTGEVIDDVVLPKWAKGDPRLFIKINREALESDYVNAHLHEWIDLIFGFKQTGEEAVKAINLFHYLSYEGAVVNIDKIDDPIEKQATIGIIHNFGQTPRQLFKKPHPRRMGDTTEAQLKIHKQPEMLIEAAAPLKILSGQPISDIKLNGACDRLYTAGASKLFVPPNHAKYIEWDYLDNSLRLCQTETAKDAVAIIWDMNRQQYVRSLVGHEGPITSVAVHEGTGDILTCCGTMMRLWTVNGDLLACKSVASVSDLVTCSIFYEGRQSEVFDSIIVITGHKKACVCTSLVLTTPAVGPKRNAGHVKIWSKVFVDEAECSDGPKQQRGKWDFKCSKTLEPHSHANAITAIHVASSARFLVTGDMAGRVTSWMFPDGSGTEMHYTHEDACMNCNSKFSVLERKINCKCCGGSFCGPCMSLVTDRSHRLCHACNGKMRAFTILNSPAGDRMPLQVQSQDASPSSQLQPQLQAMPMRPSSPSPQPPQPPPSLFRM
ncbi:hypothetical protein BC831DRAFT_502404 [Entophlyctis helioformis]|nr:hypothetical protein BC831DRAFT_502404 [Entophlyctis helioformis]